MPSRIDSMHGIQLEEIFRYCPRCGDELAEMEPRPVYYELWSRICAGCKIDYTFDSQKQVLLITSIDISIGPKYRLCREAKA